MQMNNSKQIKLGAAISYFAIAFNIIAGLIYTPWMISKIGNSNYGLYTLATSLITMLMVDFGMSAAVSRFVSKYRAEGDQLAIDRFLGVVYKLYGIIAALAFVVLAVLYFFINSIYTNLSAAEMETFRGLYVIVGLYSVVSFPFITLNGILNAYERFIELKLADLFHKVFIIAAMVVCLLMGQGVYALVLVNAVAGLLTIAVKLYFIKKKTKIKVRFGYSDRSMLKEIFTFSAWITVSSLALRLIINITPSIIVAVSATGALGAAIFGVATTVEGYVYTFATAINGMFMPRIAKIVHEEKKQEQLMPLMQKVGRLQCILLGVLIVGFAAFGKSFIADIWNKPDLVESYICALLLIIPSFFYLPMQIAKTTLIVENKVKLEATVFLIVGVLNVALSAVLSHYYGAIGAAASIFVAYMIRNVLMIVIYHRVLQLNMLHFFKEVYLKLMPQLLVALGIGLLCSRFNPISNVYLRFATNGCVLVGTYLIIMWFCGFNAYEKGMFKALLRKFRK